MFLADVAAEDSQCADAKAQRKEGLSHSGEDYLADTVLQNSVEVRIEIIFKACSTVGQSNGVYCQNQHEQQQAGHHIFGDALYAGLDAQIADTEAGENDDNHIACHGYRVAQQAAEHVADTFCVQSHEAADSHFVEIIQHPAGNSGVEHHQENIAGNSTVFIKVPFCTGRLQYVEGFCSAAYTRTADRKFRYHDGQAQKQQKAKIN